MEHAHVRPPPAFLRMLDAHGSRDPMRSFVSVEFAQPSVVPPPPEGSIPRRHLNDGASALYGSLPMCRRDGARWSMEDEHSSGARAGRVGPRTTSQWPLACPRHKACSATLSPLYITYLDTANGGVLRVVLRGRPFFLFLKLHGNKVDVLREPCLVAWCCRFCTCCDVRGVRQLPKFARVGSRTSIVPEFLGGLFRGFCKRRLQILRAS